jgi:hypothetical protein
MIVNKELRQFLIYCGKEGYATIQDADEVREMDQSSSITLQQEDWKFHDNYFGGEPYGGREVIFYMGKPVWIMTYYGRANTEINSISPIYKFLKKALALVPDEAPYRGPKEFEENEWKYMNNWQDDIDNFSGVETIYQNRNKVYFANYNGGVINQR